MADTGVKRDPLTSVTKPWIASTDLFRIKRQSLPSELPGRKPSVTLDDKGVAICKRDQCSYNRYGDLDKVFDRKCKYIC
ncbi:hypothetical protein DPMN_013850 [Dreissena polymorpha]|uniref:Uncharacterized protein n=1 Tax=Dreissena polymorpha TaxID=45954 RepID=A0A9D4S4P3_DREPO|nr:hypothetical protein DPMN_013850 [Dreissena polymorpha]